MKFLFLLLSAVMIITAGCASTSPFIPPAACTDTGQSLILKTFPDPRGLDQGLLAVQLVALQKVPGYTKADAIKVLDEIQSAIDQSKGLTYAGLVNMIMTKLKVANSLAGGIVFIVGPDLEKLSNPIPISPCDLALVEKHLARQRALVEMSGK